MCFKDKLIELRKSHNLSQEALGDKLNVTRQTVSKWELGLTTPEMDKLIELSRLFNLPIDALVGNNTVEASSPEIPACGGWHYEYKSKRVLFGLPLVHINIGHGMHKAKGIIAVGNIAKGFVSAGIASAGIISFGAVSLGGFSLGALSAGLCALGGLALGGIAIGGFALGLLAIGGLSIGIYSVGGCAIARDIAMGGYARGHIAFGNTASGDFVWNRISELTQTDYAAIRQRIVAEYPSIWTFILNIFT